MESTLTRAIVIPCAAAFAAAIALGALPAMAERESGGARIRERIDFAVVIPVVLRVVTVSEPRSVSIGPEDVARGYVDVNVATAMRVTSNNAAGVTAAISCDPALVARVEARLGGQVVAVQAPGASTRIDLGRMLDAPLGVSYRLFLVSSALPGTYRWPIALRLGPGA
jgi:hypothetical protein